MNIHKLHISEQEASAADQLADYDSKLMTMLAGFDATRHQFKDLRRSVLGIHDTLITSARAHRRTESHLRKLAAQVLETVSK